MTREESLGQRTPSPKGRGHREREGEGQGEKERGRRSSWEGRDNGEMCLPVVRKVMRHCKAKKYSKRNEPEQVWKKNKLQVLGGGTYLQSQHLRQEVLRPWPAWATKRDSMELKVGRERKEGEQGGGRNKNNLNRKGRRKLSFHR